MKLRTRILAVATALLLVLSALPAAAFAGSNPTESTVPNDDGTNTTTTTVAYDANNYIQLVKNSDGKTIERRVTTNSVPTVSAAYEALGTQECWRFSYADDGSATVYAADGTEIGTLASDGLITIRYTYSGGSACTTYSYDEKALMPTFVKRVNERGSGLVVTSEYSCSDPVQGEDGLQYTIAVDTNIASNGTVVYAGILVETATLRQDGYGSQGLATNYRNQTMYKNGVKTYAVARADAKSVTTWYDASGSVENQVEWETVEEAYTTGLGPDYVVSVLRATVDGIEVTATLKNEAGEYVAASFEATNGVTVAKRSYDASDVVAATSSTASGDVNTNVRTYAFGDMFELSEHQTSFSDDGSSFILPYVFAIDFEVPGIDSLKAELAGEADVEDGAVEKPVIVEGANAVYDGTSVPDFRSSDSIENFIAVYMDGTLVDAENYMVTAGSIRVTFTDAYLRSLSAGEHVVGIESKNGLAEATFTVASELKPAEGSGDVQNPSTDAEDGEKPSVGTGSGSDDANANDKGQDAGAATVVPVSDKDDKTDASGTPDTSDAFVGLAPVLMAAASGAALVLSGRIRKK